LGKTGSTKGWRGDDSLRTKKFLQGSVILEETKDEKKKGGKRIKNGNRGKKKVGGESAWRRPIMVRIWGDQG